MNMGVPILRAVLIVHVLYKMSFRRVSILNVILVIAYTYVAIAIASYLNDIV